AYLLGEMDRITGAARTLHDSLAELAATDGMTTFDPAFASDDASWDEWFTASAALVRTAEQALGGAAQPTTSTVSV
ncbi:MAG: hypothetical protein JWM98_1936, partial [Thermoleophilia bacterium]|nr:hypothetical protein [Thermoleophilia bacterium]